MTYLLSIFPTAIYISSLIFLPGLSGLISCISREGLNSAAGWPGNRPGRGHMGKGAVVPWGPPPWPPWPPGGVKKGLKLGGRPLAEGGMVEADGGRGGRRELVLQTFGGRCGMPGSMGGVRLRLLLIWRSSNLPPPPPLSGWWWSIGDEERVVGVGDERSRSASLDRGVDDRLGSGVPGGLIVAPLPGVGVVHVDEDIPPSFRLTRLLRESWSRLERERSADGSSCMPLTRSSSATRNRAGNSSWDMFTSPLIEKSANSRIFY